MALEKKKIESPEAQLDALIERSEPKIQKVFRSVRAAVKKRFPTANELAYDYGASIVISYSPTHHGIDGVVSLAARENEVRLYLNHGPDLPDPKKLLSGTGKQMRFITLDSASRFADPDVVALTAAAVAHATVPLAAKGKGTLTIRPTTAAKRAAAATPKAKAKAKVTAKATAQPKPQAKKK